MKRGVRWAVLGAVAAVLAVLLIAPCLFVGCVIEEGYHYQVVLGASLDRDLGFTHGSPYVNCGGHTIEVFTIETVEPEGAFDRAGVKPGDIVRDLSLTDFYKLLHDHRGREVTFEVVDGGDGPALDERPVRRITMIVPQARLEPPGSE